MSLSLSLSLTWVQLLSRLLASKIFSSDRFIVGAMPSCFSNRSPVVAAVILAQSNDSLMSFTDEFFWSSFKILSFISSTPLLWLPIADSRGFLRAHIAIARAGNSESKTYPNSGATMPALPTFITDKLDSNRVFAFSRRLHSSLLILLRFFFFFLWLDLCSQDFADKNAAGYVTPNRIDFLN